MLERANGKGKAKLVTKIGVGINHRGWGHTNLIVKTFLEWFVSEQWQSNIVLIFEIDWHIIQISR